jgi:CheY-like chemotaxis protein
MRKSFHRDPQGIAWIEPLLKRSPVGRGETIRISRTWRWGNQDMAATVLVVDDSATERHIAGSLLQKGRGLGVTYAADGREALLAIEKSPPDMVLTDMQMPHMDGLSLVQAIRVHHPGIPVVLMTAHGSEDVAVQALQRGASSYVPKRLLSRDLVPTIEKVLAIAKAERGQQRVLECVARTEIEFSLTNDATLIPLLIAYLGDELGRLRFCDKTGIIRIGVALHEAIDNAMYHGNLEVSSDLRHQSPQAYQALAEQRRQQAPFRERKVNIIVRIARDQAVYIVRDEGAGFDPSTLPDFNDPSNLNATGGRGLSLIRTFMDQVSYNETGNEITLTKGRDPVPA